MYRLTIDHPEVEYALRTGYPSWMQVDEVSDVDEDALYDERRESRSSEED